MWWEYWRGIVYQKWDIVQCHLQYLTDFPKFSVECWMFGIIKPLLSFTHNFECLTGLSNQIHTEQRFYLVYITTNNFRNINMYNIWNNRERSGAPNTASQVLYFRVRLHPCLKFVWGLSNMCDSYHLHTKNCSGHEKSSCWAQIMTEHAGHFLESCLRNL